MLKLCEQGLSYQYGHCLIITTSLQIRVVIIPILNEEKGLDTKFTQDHTSLPLMRAPSRIGNCAKGHLAPKLMLLTLLL